MRSILSLITFAAWVVGIVLAKGFWSTFFALIFPLWAWYLTAEHFLKLNGFL